MNTPNKLTLSRIFLIPFFVLLLHIPQFTANEFWVAAAMWAAFVVFVVASITDFLDGYIARKYNIVTNFGKLFDPLADKLLTMAAFVSFVELESPDGYPIFPAWAIIVILAREFLITGLRTVAVSRGQVIHADKWGKQKTIVQLVGILIVLFLLSVRRSIDLGNESNAFFDAWSPTLFRTILFVIVLLTAGSGVSFLVKNWALVRDRD